MPGWCLSCCGKREVDKTDNNAAERFEKGKRQNHLNPEHIDKIVDTCRRRKEEKRHARRVEPEPEIDLKAVHAELVEAEKEIRSARARHNAFLEELGLPPLP